MRSLVRCTLATLTMLLPCLGCRAQPAPLVQPPAMPTSAEVNAVAERVCDYALNLWRPPTTRPDSNGWVRATLYAGVWAAYRSTGEDRYREAVLRWGRSRDWTPGGGRRLGKRDAWADNLCCGHVYLDAYLAERDPRMLEGTVRACRTLIDEPERGRDEWWWADALFMAPATLSRLSAATGDPAWLTAMDSMWWDTLEHLFDTQENLLYRDSGYFKRRTPHGQKVFWGRGNGWVVGGLCRLLETFPQDDARRARYEELLRKMMGRLVALQQEDGLWRPSLLDPLQVPVPETSGSGFFCFGLAWGINHGVLDRTTYLPATLEAWRGLVSCVREDGRLGYVQPVGAAPGRVEEIMTQEYGVGAFLLAASEMAALARSAGSESVPAG